MEYEDDPRYKRARERTIDTSIDKYERTNNPIHLYIALNACLQDGIPPSERLVDTVGIALAPLGSIRPASGKRSPYEVSTQETKDIIRWQTVERLRSEGVPLREAFQAASDELVNSDFEAGGSDETIRSSYRRIQRTFTKKQKQCIAQRRKELGSRNAS